MGHKPKLKDPVLRPLGETLTDEQRFSRFLVHARVLFTIDNDPITGGRRYDIDPGGQKFIKGEGYSGFGFWFTFDPNGKLLSTGAAEG